jgi:hypothetical protein
MTWGSLENIFGLKILQLFDEDLDPGSGIFLTLDPGSGVRDGKIRIRDNRPGSTTLPKTLSFLLPALKFISLVIIC